MNADDGQRLNGNSKKKRNRLPEWDLFFFFRFLFSEPVSNRSLQPPFIDTQSRKVLFGTPVTTNSNEEKFKKKKTRNYEHEP